MEKTITVRRTSITFSLWDLGGQREFVNMLPLVCNDAVAILFMFDLSRKSTLNSVKEWYRQARGFNKVCRDSSTDYMYSSTEVVTDGICGTPDSNTLPNRHEVRHLLHFSKGRARGNHKAGALLHVLPIHTHRLYVTDACIRHLQAKRFAKAMHASLIFCSTSASINVQKIFKIVLAKAFDLKCVIPEIDGVGEPILMYVDV